MSHPARPNAADRRPEALDREVCLALLKHSHVGRLAHVLDGRPQIVPMNYAIDGDRLVVQLGTGATLAAISGGAHVAFQVDGVDEVYHQGWSVTAHGRASEVTDPVEADRLRGLPSRPWAGGPRHHVILIQPDAWTGRRIG